MRVKIQRDGICKTHWSCNDKCLNCFSSYRKIIKTIFIFKLSVKLLNFANL